MTDEEFETFLSSAYEELAHKQNFLVERYGFGTRKRWWFDQTTEELQLFDDADNVVIEADVIEIGTYSPKSNTWKWAWANRMCVLVFHFMTVKTAIRLSIRKKWSRVTP